VQHPLWSNRHSSARHLKLHGRFHTVSCRTQSPLATPGRLLGPQSLERPRTLQKGPFEDALFSNVWAVCGYRLRVPTSKSPGLVLKYSYWLFDFGPSLNWVVQKWGTLDHLIPHQIAEMGGIPNFRHTQFISSLIKSCHCVGTHF